MSHFVLSFSACSSVCCRYKYDCCHHTLMHAVPIHSVTWLPAISDCTWLPAISDRLDLCAIILSIHFRIHDVLLSKHLEARILIKLLAKLFRFGHIKVHSGQEKLYAKAQCRMLKSSRQHAGGFDTLFYALPAWLPQASATDQIYSR